MGTGVTEVRWERYPLVAACSSARPWLQVQADLGLAPNGEEHLCYSGSNPPPSTQWR